MAGDGVLNKPHINNFTGEIKPLYENKFNKVYKCHNTIVGIFGRKEEELIEWLSVTYQQYTDDEIRSKLCEFFGKIKYKHCSDIDKPSSEGVNLIHSSNSIYFLLSTKYENPIPLGMYSGNQNINSVTKKEYFFSPQINDSDKIDDDHQTLLESLFKQSFKEIYLKEYESNAIQSDAKLYKLIETFYTKVYADPDAHKKCINGRVSYSVLTNQQASEIIYIPFELSADFPTTLY